MKEESDVQAKISLVAPEASLVMEAIWKLGSG